MNIDEILQRVSKIIKDDSNKGLAKALKVAPTTASTWKDRQTIPWQNLFDFAAENKISFDWLLTGKEATQEIQHQEETSSQSINLIAKLIDQLDKRLEEQGKRLDEQGKRIDAVIELSKQSSSELKPAQGE